MNTERYNVLQECLILMEARLRSFSRNGANLEAKPGYERPFEETQQRICVLRAMLREARYSAD